MLRKWSLSNFKSFSRPTELELSPLTILAGANSSGKSSFIQRILLLKQTLSYPSSRELSINGSLLRLGVFQDVIHGGKKSATLTIGFEYHSEESEFKATDTPIWARPLEGRLAGNASTTRKVKGSFSWSDKIDRVGAGDSPKKRTGFQGTLYPHLDMSEIHLETESEAHSGPRWVRFIGADSKLTEKSRNENEFSNELQSGDFIHMDRLTHSEIVGDKPDAKIIESYNDYFIPNIFAVSYDDRKKRAEELANAICSRTSLLTIPILQDQQISSTILNMVNHWLLSQNDDPIETDMESITAQTINRRIQKYLPRTTMNRNALALERTIAPDFNSTLPTLRDDIEFALISEAPQKTGYAFPIPNVSRTFGRFARDYFSAGIRYLGPLRDEPKPVYPWEALENPTDVGTRGEHTAAVLDLNSHKRVIFSDPEEFVKSPSKSHVEMVGLIEATSAWLSYLNVASEVRTTDAGVYGHQMRVKSMGSRTLHDLTNVGVGVSQVLPILVNSLLAPPSSLLIFEQPELHLHPRVQARLGDFFLFLSRTGRQCILETHSEYLIERVRLRIAEDKEDLVHQSVKIYFVEKIKNESRVKPIEISEYGSIKNWPVDFFDQSQRESANIIKAAVAKRNVRRQR